MAMQAPIKPEGTQTRTVIETVRGEREQIVPPDYVDDSAIELTENSRKVLERRYLRRDTDGELLETPAGMFYRVALHVARVEDQHNGQSEELARTFYDLVSQYRFFPNSPTFTGAGTPLGQLAACFVLPIEDDMGKSGDGIFSTLRVAALIQQTGGGNGFSFNRLRPKGDIVHTSSGRATGPVGFLRVYDQAFGEIAQGGTRRGANMGVLRVDHPDIEEFIECKESEGAITNFNISVAITDEFMQAVRDDEDFNLRNPRNDEVWKTVRARDLFDKIIRYAHHNGEPGSLFIDAANRSNPVPHLYDLEATNPCGEQWLGPYENCCLGSVNLAKHVTYDDDGQAWVDWEQLERTVSESTHFLDNVVSANAYVPSVPEVAEAAYRARRIGLGVMGLGDMMYKLGIRYGSEEGQEFAAQIMEFVRFHTMKKSIELAEKRGPFLAFKGSIYDAEQPGGMQWQPPQPITPHTRDWNRPALDWQEIVDGIEAHGIRNAAQTTVAPTGTIATVCGCEGYGCEPVFALGYIRHFRDGDNDVELAYTSPLFDKALAQTGLSERRQEEIRQHVATYGNCQTVPDLPEEMIHTFAVSSDITAEEHVRMQAAIQAFVDNSISKTCNFPETATEEDVGKAYMLAWELGCKGLTVYVTGSREQVVLETKATKEKKTSDPISAQPQTQVAYTNGSAIGKESVSKLDAVNEAIDIATNGDTRPHVTKRPRPSTLMGTTYRKDTPLGTAYITVNSDEREEPFEVFLNVGKAGSEVAAVSEAMGRLVSLILRMPTTLSPNERLRWVLDEMAGIGGGRPLGFGANRVLSLPDGVAQVLAEHLSIAGHTSDELPAEQLALPIDNRPVGDICPDCGEAAFLNIEGCRKCYVCGYSEC